MASHTQSIHYPRAQAQELVAFLGKLSIDSGAGSHYTFLKAALEAPEVDITELLTPIKGVKVLAKTPKTPAKASATTDDAKTIARKKHAAANARKWRARKAAERAAALEAQKQNAAGTLPLPLEVTIETSPEPVLFTG